MSEPFKYAGRPLTTQNRAQVCGRRTDRLTAQERVALWSFPTYTIGSIVYDVDGSDAHKTMDKVRKHLGEMYGHFGTCYLWEHTATHEDVKAVMARVYPS